MQYVSVVANVNSPLSSCVAKRSDNKNLTGSFLNMDVVEDLKLFHKFVSKNTESKQNGFFKDTEVCNLVVHACMYSHRATKVAFMQLLVALLTIQRQEVVVAEKYVKGKLSLQEVEKLASTKLPGVWVKHNDQQGQTVLDDPRLRQAALWSSRYKRYQVGVNGEM